MGWACESSAGWMDGMVEPPAREQQEQGRDVVLHCRHCGSDKLHRPRSNSDTILVQFECSACMRTSQFSLECGYRIVYLVN